ncbi:hypothetical protein WN51_08113 [Melipona quadrifasciata]|uniref:Uncharacterized protein n=1 Tax=Melipona quadrifasciata TaxID=166423 RepID=A0A0M8ZN96_9HYME|nr:hypothetical protein WN51_08113 [Melipona quadrifasciata]
MQEHLLWHFRSIRKHLHSNSSHMSLDREINRLRENRRIWRNFDAVEGIRCSGGDSASVQQSGGPPVSNLCLTAVALAISKVGGHQLATSVLQQFRLLVSKILEP